MNMCTSVVYDKNQYLLNIKCAPNEILLSVLSSAGIIYERGLRLPKVCLKLGCIYIYMYIYICVYIYVYIYELVSYLVSYLVR